MDYNIMQVEYDAMQCSGVRVMQCSGANLGRGNKEKPVELSHES